ncbi:MAG: ribosome silencing factor [Epsilonproteobacteria bacterium]|nr:ribosome silencing factor [Campylobacterota bacterium]NPA56814.1 ribosome silencing factor [Campylobacterota bacterium]
MNRRLERIRGVLEEKKGEDVVVVDMRPSDYFVDWVVIATATSDRHTAALLESLKEKLKPAGEEFLKIDEGDEWIVVDLGDIVIHLMTEPYRRKYQIEEFLSQLLADRSGRGRER